jgi:hypothetical protein
MKKLILLTNLFLFLFIILSAQETCVKGIWILDNIELSDFADPEHAFGEEASFFAYFLDKTNKLDLSNPHLAMNVGGDEHLFDVKIENSELLLSFSNTVYIKKNEGLVETKSSMGETSFKIKQDANKLILFRKNQTFFERYTFIVAN